MLFVKGTDSKGNDYTFVDFHGALAIGIWHAFWPEILITIFSIIFALITGISITGTLFSVAVLIALATLSIILYRFNKLTLSHLLFYLPFWFFTSIFTQLDGTPLFTGKAHYGSEINYTLFDIASGKEYSLDIGNFTGIAQTIITILIIGTLLFALAIAFAPKLNWAVSSLAFIIASIFIFIVGLQFFKFDGKYLTKAATSFGVECIVHSLVGLIIGILFIAFRKRSK